MANYRLQFLTDVDPGPVPMVATGLAADGQQTFRTFQEAKAAALERLQNGIAELAAAKKKLRAMKEREVPLAPDGE